MNDDNLYLIQIIQENIVGEYEAILEYEDAISCFSGTDYEYMVKVIEDIIKEEKSHIGELQNLLYRLSTNEEVDTDIDNFNAGFEEVDEILEECRKIDRRKKRL